MLTNADLMAIFNFTEDDLKANRAGHISERQLGRLKRDSENATGCGLLVLIGLVLFGAIAFFANSSSQTRLNSNPNTVLFISIAAVVLVLLAIFLAKARPQADVDERTVASTSGAITLRMIPMKTGFMYLMKIDSKEFAISGYTYGTLADDHKADLQTSSFRAYFAPASRKVLSVEVLDTP